jgi:serine/threonine-protein kinase RsbW
MTEKHVSQTLDSSLESVNKAEELAEAFAKQAGFSEEDTNRISMSVREAVVNAVLHGNAYDPAKKVQVSLDLTPKDLTISVGDQGKGLNPETIPDPLDPDNILKQSGRGVFLMRTFMDEVRFRDLHPGTEITLIKHVGGAPADVKEESQ